MDAIGRRSVRRLDGWCFFCCCVLLTLASSYMLSMIVDAIPTELVILVYVAILVQLMLDSH